MMIEFVKMQGAGNDYVYLDLVSGSGSRRGAGRDARRGSGGSPKRLRVEYGDLARKISSRHFGVGGDGLVLILPSRKADYRMRMFNADGSEAEMCGNAVRCVAKYLSDRGLLAKRSFTLETGAGVKNLTMVEKGARWKPGLVKVDMGPPILEGRKIPIDVDAASVIGVEVMGRRGTAVSMGNPHVVFFVDEITDRQVLEDGPKIERSPLFPKRTNVEFVHVLGKGRIRMRVWERGSGETLACGTGACASVVAAVLNGLTERKVEVELLGGTLTVEWEEKSGSVFMTGPAQEVFSGTYAYAPVG